MSIKESLLKSIDSILAVRDSVGGVIQESFLITRTWSGSRIGDGDFVDEENPLKPSPGIKDIALDIRANSAGFFQAGDLYLMNVSKNLYTKEDLRTDTKNPSVEKFIKVGEDLYRTVHIKEKLVVWDVHIRKIRRMR